ncbi:MAG: glycosyltransferase [Candidatus Dadabacteria bacterium]|nr:MAG: glycosyltransferase [Candidatus Dadabacteria bacterium]
MRVLFLAPEPFFEERGTPIAVRLALEVLSNREKDEIILLTYSQGRECKIKGVKHIRCGPSFLKGIPPGPSLKKFITDIFFTFKVFSVVNRAEKEGKPFDLIHAVEESVYIAALLNKLKGIPYIYDMDSSLSLQMQEKYPFIKVFLPFFEKLEKSAIRNSCAVVPVCDALLEIAKKHGASQTEVLRDISLLETHECLSGEYGSKSNPLQLKKHLNLKENDKIALYVGNLEKYQGVDLLLDAFCHQSLKDKTFNLVIIGGAKKDINKYQEKYNHLVKQKKVHFIGPRPVPELGSYLSQADVLVSPRIKGNNTPMKIYSYLHAGKPIVATDLPTHRQVLNERNSILSPPDKESFAKALYKALTEPCQEIAREARLLAEKEYSFEVFTKKLNKIYDLVDAQVNSTAKKRRLAVAS